MKFEFTNQGVKAAPAVAGWLFSWMTLDTVVALATILYIVMQAAYLVWKWRGEAKARKPRRKK